MSRFVDASGKPGPATWRNGTYPAGEADFPVGGVSWFEALAYANFAGKSIPTTFHWTAAANFSAFSGTLRMSNFRGEGPARAGLFQGVGRFGTYDMAGNLTEWCWNLLGGMRTVRGGSWADPEYLYQSADAAPAFDRNPSRGFRCIRDIANQPAQLRAEVPRPLRPVQDEQPVSDEVFQTYRSFYAYDRTELNVRLESVDDSSPWWKRERVSFDAAYPGERVIAYVFLPRNTAPPYQTMVFFPPGQAQREKTSRELEMRRMDFVVKSGRAVVYPIYKSTYERATAGGPRGPNARRDIRIQWFKDFGRSLDYIETRRDLDRDKLVFFGASQGAGYAGIPLALDARMKTAILQGGGLPTVAEADLPGEVRVLNFLPRVRIPVLMLNGKHDFFNPVEEVQKPLFQFPGDSGEGQAACAVRLGSLGAARGPDSRDPAMAGPLPGSGAPGIEGAQACPAPSHAWRRRNRPVAMRDYAVRTSFSGSQPQTFFSSRLMPVSRAGPAVRKPKTPSSKNGFLERTAL
jgi:hypothetical protein